MLFDTTNAVIVALQEVATLQTNGDLITADQLNFAIQQAANSLASAPSWQLSTISAGVAAFERRGKLTYVKIDTEGQAASDELTSLQTIGQQASQVGDLLFVLAASEGREIVAVFDGLQNGRARLRSASDGLLLIYTPAGWREVARWPNNAPATKPLETDSAVIQSGSINYTASLISVTAVAGETRASATITVTAASGLAGSAMLYSDDGSGIPTFAGMAGYASAVTTSFVASELANSVDDTGVLESDNLVANSFQVLAPVGTGSAGNSYSLSASVSGGLTLSLGSFSGGADGVESASTLSTITGGIEGSVLILRNAMLAEAVTLSTSGNIGVSSATVVPAGDSIILIYSESLSKWLPIQRRAQCLGSLYMVGNTTDTTVSASGTYYPCSGTTTSEVAIGFTIGSNSMTLTGIGGLFQLSANISYHDGANNRIGFGFSVNGTTLPQVMTCHSSNVGNTKAVTMTAFANLSTGDVIRVTTANLDTVANITIRDLQFSAKTATYG